MPWLEQWFGGLWPRLREWLIGRDGFHAVRDRDERCRKERCFRTRWNASLPCWAVTLWNRSAGHGGWTFVLQNRRNGLQDGADGLQGADRGPSIARFTMSDARVELRGASLLWSGAGCVVQDGRFQGQGAGFALWEECYWMSNG